MYIVIAQQILQSRLHIGSLSLTVIETRRSKNIMGMFAGLFAGQSENFRGPLIPGLEMVFLFLHGLSSIFFAASFQWIFLTNHTLYPP